MPITASQYINNGSREDSFISVYHYIRPARSKDTSPIEMYGLLSVRSESAIPGQKIAKFAWDGIVDGFEYSKSDSFNESLKSALQESTRRIKQLVNNDSSLSQHKIDINFSVFVFNKKTVYVGIVGGNDIYVYKNGRFVNITEMLTKKSAQTAGLVLEDEDLLFTSTSTVIKRNMARIMGQQNKECIKERIVDFKQNIGKGEGILMFDTGEVVKVKASEEKCLDEVVNDKDISTTASNSDEPSDSDYISINKEEEKVEERPNRSEKDLKYFVNKFTSRISKIWKSLSSALIPMLSNFRGKVKAGILNMWWKVKEKFQHKKVFKRISARVSQSDLGRRGRNLDSDLKSLKIDGYKKRDKRVKRFKTVFLVIAGIALVAFGVKFTIDQKEARAIHRQADGILASVEEMVNKAEEKAYTDRSSAETYVFKAQSELQNIPSGLNESDETRRAELESKVLGIQDDLYKRVRVSERDGSAESYLDTRLAFGETSSPTDIALYRDDKGTEYLVIADPQMKAVYRVSLYNKEVQKVPDKNGVLKKPQYLYIGKSGLFVLDMEVGVVTAKFDSNGWFKDFETITGLGSSSLGAQDAVEFAVLTDSDNVYVLDRAKQALLKSSNFGSGYGLSFSYIVDDSFVNANDVISDLSVYILTSGSGGLRRYNYSYTEQKQVSAPVTVMGLNGDFKNLTCGYTQQSLDYGLYLFDSEDRRAMKFEKPKEGGGETLHPNQVLLTRQYAYQGSKENVWSDVHDLVVDVKEEYMYLLDDTTIWKIRL